MHTIEIPEKNKTFYFPADLSECDTVQYINICKILYQLNNGEIDKYTFLVQASKFLILGKKEKFDEKTEAIKYDNIYQIASVLESFFEEDENGKSVIKQYYIHNPIEKAFGVTRNYYGPSDEFNNVSFGEYVDALSFFYDYIDTQDPQYLYLLFATFYREKNTRVFSYKNYTKDKRVPYNAERVSELAEIFKKIDFGIIYGFFLLFSSFQKYLTTAKIYVQGKEIDLSILYQDFPTDQQMAESGLPGLGMKSLLYTIAENGAFGNKKEVEEAPFWEIYIRLYDVRKRDFDALANHKKQSQNA